MSFIELFAGIGGFRYGLERVCIEKTKGGNQEGIGNTTRQFKQQSGEYTKRYTCVYANEWDKYAATIYEKNFGERPDTRDITTVDANEIPDHDLLTAGIPCQAFSIAGKRKGFEDTRGTLFFDTSRILHHKKPRYFLLENVKGLLSHDNGATLRTIIYTLYELGYDLQWQVLNSKNFGVPQNRERVFIIGHLRGESRPEVFPIYAICEENNNLATEGNGHGNRTWSGALRKEGTSSFGSGDVFITNETRIRRLTPVECERLQGFPDNWTEGVSDTQRYKMLGNTVTTNVITEIGKRLLND